MRSLLGHSPSISALLFASLFVVAPLKAGTLEQVPANASPSARSRPPWEVVVQGSGWLAGLTGTLGTHGITTHINIGVGDYINKVNALAGLGVELRRGRVGANEGFIYLGAQTSVNGSGVVNKSDLHVQQYLNQFYFAYRILEAPHSWLDLIAGF